MDLIVTNAAIITGDGYTHHRVGWIGIAGGRIAKIAPGAPVPLSGESGPRLNAKGETVFPGLINAHAHGCIHGPAMPSGSQPFAARDVVYERNRHLLGGTTTLLNVCGLALPTEIDIEPGQCHPLQVHVTTAHTPASVAAARAVDGTGLTDAHFGMDVEAVVRLGAVALGEGGGGQTLGGGAQDYRFIPSAVLGATGREIEPHQARVLKETLLGRALENTTAAPDQAFTELCRQFGLLERSSPNEIALTIAKSVLGPVALAQRGLEELAAASSRLRLPAILHTAVPSAATVTELAQKYPDARLIAAHCNHPSFTPDEAVLTATRLRELGVSIDASTLDTISTHWRNRSENLDALVGAGVIDTLSTDFAGGHWDGLGEAIQRMVAQGQLSAPAAIALATGNVAKCFPAFADRGALELGNRADIVIADSKNLSRVRHVIIGGKIVVKDGTIAAWGR